MTWAKRPAKGRPGSGREETGWHVEPYAMIGVYDSRLVGTMEGQHVYHLSFLCRPLFADPEPPSHKLRNPEYGLVRRTLRCPRWTGGHRIWVPNAFRAWRGDLTGAYFDRSVP